MTDDRSVNGTSMNLCLSYWNSQGKVGEFHSVWKLESGHCLWLFCLYGCVVWRRPSSQKKISSLQFPEMWLSSNGIELLSLAHYNVRCSSGVCVVSNGRCAGVCYCARILLHAGV